MIVIYMLECALLYLKSLESFSSLVILGEIMVDRSYDLAVIGGGIIGLGHSDEVDGRLSVSQGGRSRKRGQGSRASDRA